MAQPKRNNFTPEEACLPPTAQACLSCLIQDGEISPELTECSFSANSRTVQVTLVWEKLPREDQKRFRQGKRKQQTDTRRNGDFTKLKEQAQKHGRNPRRSHSDSQSTHIKSYSDLFTKEEIPETPTMQSSRDNNPVQLSYASLVKAFELQDTSPLTKGTEVADANSNVAANPSQEVVRKKKPRNRRFKRRNKTVLTQTEKEETETAESADQEEKLPEMFELLNCEELQQ